MYMYVYVYECIGGVVVWDVSDEDARFFLMKFMELLQVSTHTHTHTHIHTYTYICIYTYAYTYTGTRTLVRFHTLRAYTTLLIHSCTHTLIHS